MPTYERIMVKVDEYQKDNETKGKYVEAGVLVTHDSDGSKYILLHPNVDLAGCLIQQRLLNPDKAGKSVMCSVFSNDRNSGNQGNQSPSTGGQATSVPTQDFDDDIPF